MTIYGFEFEIQERGHTRWVRLMGAGGLLGDGALAAVNNKRGDDRAAFVEKVKDSLLLQARAPLLRGLGLRVLRSWDLPPEERFETRHPCSVLRVREISND